jgi:hypothetical protein
MVAAATLSPHSSPNPVPPTPSPSSIYGSPGHDYPAAASIIFNLHRTIRASATPNVLSAAKTTSMFSTNTGSFFSLYLCASFVLSTFQILCHFFHTRPFVFNTFGTHSSKTPGVGYPTLNVRTKNEARIR